MSASDHHNQQSIMLSSPPSLRARTNSGYSLVAVITIGIISSLWVAAMMSSMLPTYEKIISAKTGGLARISAEAAVDYTIDQLNSSFSAGAPTSKLDAASEYTSKTSVLPDQATGNTGARATVTVTNEQPPTSSMLYDAKIANLIAKKFIKNPFRRIEATATIGGYSKHVQVMVGPVFSEPDPLPFVAFGDTNVIPIGLVQTDSFNIPSSDPIYNKSKYQNAAGNYTLYGDLGSNAAINYVGSGSLLRGITIGGSHYQFNPTVAAPAGGGSGGSGGGLLGGLLPPSVSFPWLKVYDNVYSNGDTSGYWPRGRYPQNIMPWHNVYGWSNPGPAEPTAPLQPGPNGQVNSYQNYPQWTLQPAPSAPAGTVNLGSVALSGNATLTFQDGAPAATGAIGNLTGGTYRLAPGNYAIKSLSLAGNSRIRLSTSKTVNLYFEGASAQAVVFSVASTASVNMTSNAKADELHIYYNGTKTISLSGQERAFLYAPRTTIYIGQGLSQPAHFYGAVVGDVVYLNGGVNTGGGSYLHYDASLKQSNPLSGGPTNFPVVGFKAISWQEL